MKSRSSILSNSHEVDEAVLGKICLTWIVVASTSNRQDWRVIDGTVQRFQGEPCSTRLLEVWPVQQFVAEAVLAFSAVTRHKEIPASETTRTTKIVVRFFQLSFEKSHFHSGETIEVTHGQPLLYPHNL